ncbi:odorant receptor 30a-like isoform X2 [Cylas formicarius]|uniref:odorant receptor 30a-like isoform X2 n=1 Tax=Cylas formicarius TaxID=197179 RepID=UPI0029589A1A|nr:odorant receptor 30a-like isoform X2 [Cylas formicarius]
MARSFLKFSERIMILTGIWHPALITGKSALQKLYLTYYVFVKLYFALFFTSASMELFLSVGPGRSSPRLFKQLSYIIPSLSIFYAKIACGTVNFRRIVSYVKEKEKLFCNCEDEDISNLHSRCYRIARLVNMILILTVASTGIAVVLENLWRNINTLPYNSTSEIVSIIELHYFGISRKPAMVFVLLEEFMCVFNTTLTLATKSITLTCVIFAGYALKVLQIKFRNIGQDGDVNSSLNHVITQHQDVTRYISRLNDLVKYLILIEYVLESLNVAAVSVGLVTNGSQTVLSSVSYLSYLLLQIFLLGWTANESIALSDALYECSWYEQNESSRKVLLLMIAFTQKPLKLTIGPFDAMTLQSALTVIKGSYSLAEHIMFFRDETKKTTPKRDLAYFPFVPPSFRLLIEKLKFKINNNIINKLQMIPVYPYVFEYITS